MRVLLLLWAMMLQPTQSDSAGCYETCASCVKKCKDNGCVSACMAKKMACCRAHAIPPEPPNHCACTSA